MWKRAVGWVTLCKWIIQQPRRIPALLNRPPSEETSLRGQLEAGVVFFYWPHRTRRVEDRDEEARASARAQVPPHRSVMFKWEREVIPLSRVLFLHAALWGCIFSLDVWWCWQLPFSWAEPLKWRTHIQHQAEDVLHISFFSSPSLQLYTHSAPASPPATIDRLTDLSLWKIDRTTLLSALRIDFSWTVVTVLTSSGLFIPWESVPFSRLADNRLKQSHVGAQGRY